MFLMYVNVGHDYVLVSKQEALKYNYKLRSTTFQNF